MTIEEMNDNKDDDLEKYISVENYEYDDDDDGNDDDDGGGNQETKQAEVGSSWGI